MPAALQVAVPDAAAEQLTPQQPQVPEPLIDLRPPDDASPPPPPPFTQAAPPPPPLAEHPGTAPEVMRAAGHSVTATGV
eukprot:319475-Alexandrium_andersonii.AAC.1